MARIFRFMLLITLLIALPAPLGVQAATPPAPNGPDSTGAILTTAPAGYYDGLIQYSSITNCFSIIQGAPYLERGAGAYVGYYSDPNNSVPAPNSVYYVHVVVGGLGNSCSGMRAYVEIALPAATAPAVDATNKVRCYYDGVELSLAECPQNLPGSGYNPGAYAIFSSDSAHANTWPIPQGHILEIQIPVRTSAQLTNSQMYANVWMLDGNTSPWLQPSQGVYVFNNTNALVYPNPSATQITSTTAHTEVYLYSNGSGSIFFDLGTSPGSWTYTTAAFAISAPGGWTIFVDWSGLLPNTPYYWRARYAPNSGTLVIGNNQTMTTLPDGQSVLGQGAATDCTEAALNAVLPTAKNIQFNCGLQPVTITLTSPKSITANLTIDGGNLVTLAFSGTGNHFNVQNGAHLTLTKITLSNGNHTSGCGGAIYVASGGLLTLNKTIFDSNKTNVDGGAICNSGSADITNTLFSNNNSLSMGGAIENYATLSIANSTFTSNTAGVNGGAVDSIGSLTITNSSFTTNHAGYRGGGIYNYVGTLTLTGSTVSGNTGGMYGGGLGNDSSTTTITNSTITGNSSPNQGGGIETSGTIALTILNSTIANNTAGLPGGNLSVGSAANPNVHLKNTLVAAGSPDNCDNTVNSQGNNLESANTCGLAAAGDKINLDPKLGPLQNNGGAAFTLALLPGSPAIDAGTNSGCPAVDQRSISRPQGPNCDIGAFESRGFTLTQTSGSGQTTAVNAPFALPLTVTLTETGGVGLPGATITFGAPSTGASANFSSPTATTDSSGIASVNVTANGTTGSYAVTASASGGTASAPFALTNNNNPNTTTTLSSSANPSSLGKTVALTASVSSSSGIPAGNVAFKDGGIIIPGCGTQALNGSGQAVCMLTLPVVGTHNLSAEYGGSPNYNGSVSTLVVEEVTMNKTFLPGVRR